MDAAVLVPVKTFARAKLRLAPALDAAAREALAKAMAAKVIAAAAPLPVLVVCDDHGVATWAEANGAGVVWAPGRGLDGAVAHGVEHLAASGVARAVVAHGDLPLATGLARLAVDPGVTLVPDRRDDGTNVVVVATAAGFRFSYGPGSFRRHCAEAQRIGLALRVVRAPALTLDVDRPADLDVAEGETARCS